MKKREGGSQRFRYLRTEAARERDVFRYDT